MADKTAPRLKARYTEQVRPALQKEFQHRNVMEIPRVVKVVVNMGVGEAVLIIFLKIQLFPFLCIYLLFFQYTLH